MRGEDVVGVIAGPSALPWLLLAHAAATLAMVGLIWFVQVVHYPLMRTIPPEAFVAYERSHTRRTTFVVAPLMLVEAASMAGLWLHREHLDSATLIAGTLLLAVVWLSTFGVQVPMHGRLERGKDEAVIGLLVASNWIRTVAWTMRGIVALALAVGVRAT